MSRKLTTAAGRRRTEARLAEALAEYARICASNPEAAGAGDSSVWHDNFAYEENQRLMHQAARRVRDLREELADLDVVDPPPAPAAVEVGVRVVVVDAFTGRRQALKVAGWNDGDMAAGRVAYNSPFGRALLGARVGDVCEVRAPAGLRELEVVAIEHPGDPS